MARPPTTTEARLADEARYSEWEALWGDDALYWVPMHPGADPELTLSYVYDNRARIRSRVAQIWPDPDRFDVLRRQEQPHVAFGFGPHVCLGASLARMEARVLFDELLRTFPDFQVTGPAVRGRSTLVAMVSELPAAFGSRESAPARV
jgi:hypothetical protein